MPLRFKFILVIVGTVALAKATALWTVPAAYPEAPTHHPDCTYNGDVKFCVASLPEDPSAVTDHTVLIHWLDGEITSVWFLSDGSTEVGAKVILNHNKRGRIIQVSQLEDGRQRLHVKSETGNQLSFLMPPTINPPLPSPVAAPLQP